MRQIEAERPVTTTQKKNDDSSSGGRKIVFCILFEAEFADGLDVLPENKKEVKENPKICGTT